MKTTKKSLVHFEKNHNAKIKKVAIIFSIILTTFVLAGIFSSCESQTKKSIRENYSAEVLMSNFENICQEHNLNAFECKKNVFTKLSIEIESWKKNPQKRLTHELNIFMLLRFLDTSQQDYLKAYYESLILINPSTKYQEFTRLIKQRLDEIRE